MRMGEWEIDSVSERLPDNPGELAFSQNLKKMRLSQRCPCLLTP